MALGKSGGGSGAIRAGAAYVELFGKDSALIRTLDNAQRRLSQFGKTVATAGATLAAGGAGILAPIAGLFATVTDRATTLDRLATQLGTTVESVSALAYAFEAAGVKQEEFIDVVKSLQQKLFEAADGQDELFVRLGLNVRQLMQLPLADQLKAIGDALSSVPNASDRAAVALKVLGGQGQKMLRVLGDGGGALDKLQAEAQGVGAVVSKDMASAARRVDSAWTRATSAVKYAFYSIGAALLPEVDSIESFADAIVNIARTVREFIETNRGLVLGATAVGAALAAAGGVLVAVGTAFGALSFGVTGLIVGLKVLGTIIGAVVSPLGLAAGAVAGLGYLFATQTDAGRALADTVGGELADAYRSVAGVAVEAFQGITSALRRGDLQAAGQLALAGLNVVFRQGLAALVELWHSATDALIAPIQQVGHLFGEVFTSIVDLFGAMRSAVVGYVNFTMPIWQAFGDFFGNVWREVGDTFKMVVGGMLVAFAPAVGVLGSLWKSIAPVFEGGFTETISRLRDMWTVFTDGLRRAFVDMLAALFRQAGNIAGAFGGTDLAASLEEASQVATRAAELIEKERDLKIARRAKEREEELKAARDARGADLDAARAATDAAKAAFADLIKAEADRATVKAPRLELPGGGDGARLTEALAKSVRGLTLSPGDYRAVFAVGDTVAARSLRVQEQTRDKVGEVVKVIQDKKGVEFA